MPIAAVTMKRSSEEQYGHRHPSLACRQTNPIRCRGASMVRDLRGTVVAHLPDRSGSPRRPVSSTSPSTRKRLALLGCDRLDADQRSWVLGTISSRAAFAVASDKRDDGITQKILARSSQCSGQACGPRDKMLAS